MRTRDTGYGIRARRIAAGFVLFCIPYFVSRIPALAEDGVAASTEAVSLDEPTYAYNATSRDPFIPLTGGPVTDMGVSQDKEPGAFNPTSMELKGIIRTRVGRWAMLTGGGGERYVVENGKIHDAKKKPVQGYVGIIKEKTLVLIGPNNQVTELKLKKDQEEKAKP